MAKNKPASSAVDWERKHGIKEGRPFTDSEGKPHVLVVKDRKPQAYWEDEKGNLVGPMPYIITIKDIMNQPAAGGGAPPASSPLAPTALPQVGAISPTPPAAAPAPPPTRKDLMSKLKQPSAPAPAEPAPIDFGFSKPEGK